MVRKRQTARRRGKIDGLSVVPLWLQWAECS